MKKAVLMLVSVVLLAVSLSAKTIDDKKLKTRKQMAVELISSDEGFLAEYMDKLSDNELYYFYQLAFKKAEEVAEETKNIEDDNEAYVYMENKIDGKNGIKDQIRAKVSDYLKGKYQLNEIKVDPVFKKKIISLRHAAFMVQLQKKMSALN